MNDKKDNIKHLIHSLKILNQGLDNPSRKIDITKSIKKILISDSLDKNACCEELRVRALSCKRTTLLISIIDELIEELGEI
jgi:hypothetical protein